MACRFKLRRDGKKTGNRFEQAPLCSNCKTYIFLHSINLWMIGARMISIA